MFSLISLCCQRKNVSALSDVIIEDLSFSFKDISGEIELNQDINGDVYAYSYSQDHKKIIFYKLVDRQWLFVTEYDYSDKESPYHQLVINNGKMLLSFYKNDDSCAEEGYLINNILKYENNKWENVELSFRRDFSVPPVARFDRHGNIFLVSFLDTQIYTYNEAKWMKKKSTPPCDELNISSEPLYFCDRNTCYCICTNDISFKTDIIEKDFYIFKENDKEWEKISNLPRDNYFTISYFGYIKDSFFVTFYRKDFFRCENGLEKSVKECYPHVIAFRNGKWLEIKLPEELKKEVHVFSDYKSRFLFAATHIDRNVHLYYYSESKWEKLLSIPLGNNLKHEDLVLKNNGEIILKINDGKKIVTKIVSSKNAHDLFGNKSY
jgi:hypothetical protein